MNTRLRTVKSVPTMTRKNHSEKAEKPVANKNEEQETEEIALEDLKGVTTIGEGSFGTVMLVQHCKSAKSTQAFALKIQSKDFLRKRKFHNLVANEVEILKSVQHPLVNTLHRTFEDEVNVYMLLEYVPGGDMFSLISKRGAIMDDKAHMFYTACILSSLEALHEQNVIYRDLKPENILIDAQGYTRLVDFGFAKRLTGRTYTPCGTPEYFSPELILGEGYGKGNDIWGLGILVYELTCGFNPFARPGYSQRDTVQSIVHDPLRFHPLQRSKEGRVFLSSVLEKKVWLRGGCRKTGIGALKTHAWFKELNWADLEGKKVEAPWVPGLKSELDCEHFDEFESKRDVPENLCI